MNGKGLLKLPYDERDYSHDSKFGSLGASQLPTADFTVYDSFVYVVKRGDTLSALAIRFGMTLDALVKANVIPNPNLIFVGQSLNVPARPMSILNQLDLDFCTAFAGVTLQYDIYGIPFDPFWQMAKTKEIIGSYTQYGASLRDSAMSFVKYGALPAQISPYVHNGSPLDKTRDFLANWANYPASLDTLAKKYKDLSFFKVDGPYDFFDNLRSTLWIHRNDRQAVSIGLNWHPEWTEAPGGIIPSVMPTSQGEGHDMAFVGQKMINGVEYVIGQQTWGLNAGDNGKYYFPREIMDQIALQGFGAFIFSRFDGSGIKLGGFLGSVLEAVKSFLGL